MAMPFPWTRKGPLDGWKWIIHLLLILSILLIGFPLYYGFVISTQSIDEVIKVPQSLIPSGHLLENYITVWNRIHMGRLLFNGAVVVVGIASTVPTGTQLPEWNLVMAAAMMALVPPVLVVICLQHWFVHGLLETEK